MKNIDKITEEVLREFGDRKTKGRIDFVVDIITKQIYPVPREIEHSRFVPELPDYSPKTSKYVPIQFRLDNGIIEEVLVGASSYEAKFKVRHTLEELQKAKMYAWVLAANSNIPIEVKRDKVFRNYAKK